MSKTLVKMNEEVQKSLPKIDKTKSPKDYFLLAGAFMKSAGEYKRAGDIEGAYFNLKAYCILIDDRLPTHPDIKSKEFIDEFYFNQEKSSNMKKELDNLANAMSSSSSDPKSKPLPLKKDVPLPMVKKNMMVVKSNDTMSDKMITTLAQDERVQSYVGNKVSQMAQNEQVQEKVALSISNACKDDKVKRGLGEAIAKNTDNEILKVMARNEHVQDAVANTIKNTVGNKEVQKKIGKAISDAAQDKETQKKVAQGMVTVGKGAVKGGALLGKFGLATAKFAYGEYTKSDKTDVKK
jgi:hypothetical protein